MEADIGKLAEEIMDGRRLQRGEGEITGFQNAELHELTWAADRIRKALVGDKVDLCTILSGRSGRCSENCKFCAQSAFSETGCREYEFLPTEAIVQAARENEKEKVDRFSIVTSGRTLTGEAFENCVEAMERMSRELRIELCGSFGLLEKEQLARLHRAGMSCYHENLETSPGYFKEICTTHSIEEKIHTVRLAMEEGLHVCCGGIIGMGESWEDRVDLALTLAELGIASIPLNLLIPIRGTPMEHQEKLSEEEVLRTIAMFRFLNPTATIRLAGGRAGLRENGRAAFLAGASAAITGNMLTTCGSTIQKDRAMFMEMGREVTPGWELPGFAG